MNIKNSVSVSAVVLSLLVMNPQALAQNFTNWSPDGGSQEAPSKLTSEEEKINDVLNRVAAEGIADDSVEAVEEMLPGQEGSSRYTLGPTDVIQVSVMRHPEVSGDYFINQEGKIQYEFVGDIQITGKTKDEAAKLIAEKLSEYIISPEVSVKITGYNSKVVYVVGEVGRPGKIFMRGDTISIREALMQAGLPQLTGVTRKSRLITPSESGKADIRKVDVYALLYEGDLRENLEMKPGDVIYIPATFLTKAMRAIQPVAAPIGTAASTGRTVTTGF
ncbi:MAG TPA: polysaccharide biosynthesis/export family protein [Candidatus Omnitrophota bacterium]|jgi:polysaccharide export outer membrane protein|nr:polysaccharide biosynthesis/export family protein [Candidatus Omnitrophota bacterium]HPN55701.1 polysaccharide biosynthesis/export family protein [Candidatus Omnitrophota bacterium]